MASTLQRLVVAIWVLALPCAVQAQAPTRNMGSVSVQSADAAELQNLLEELSRVGGLLAKANTPSDIVSAAMRQVDVLGQLAARSKPEERTSWLRQMADTLQLAASNGPTSDHAALQRLEMLSLQVAQSMPGSSLAAYIAFRELGADYSAKISSPEVDVTRVQQAWHDRLLAFVQSYREAEDAPTAMMELAAVSESLGRKSEARSWYQHVAQDFPSKPAAQQAEGNLHWMDLQGQVLHLALPLLFADNDQQDVPFDIEELRGKVVIVCFWSNPEPRSSEELSELNQLATQYRTNGLRLLCVNMDGTPKEARMFLGGPQGPAVHVFQRGGLQGSLALRYGLTALPKLLLIGRDGKVLLQPAGIAELQESLREGFGNRNQESGIRNQ
jgi:Thioredoxin-like